MLLVRVVFGLASGAEAASLVVVGSHHNLQGWLLALYAAGIALTLLNLLVLMLCVDAWEFMCEYLDHRVPYKNT